MATLVLARLTFLEAIRRRILLAAFLLGLAFLLLYGIGFHFMQENMTNAGSGSTSDMMRTVMSNFLTLAGLYAVNFLAIAMGALVAAETLAGEIQSGTIQAVVTKPIARAQIIVGKWLGLAVLLALYLLLMAGGVMVLAYLQSGYIAPNPASGVALIYLSALLVMTITLTCSSMFTALATGGVIFGLYGISFIGGWVEQFGAFFQNDIAVQIGVVASLFIPNDALWRRASYEMTPAIAQVLGMSGGPLVTFSVPSEAMIIYAVLYMAGALALAAWQFQKRDL